MIYVLICLFTILMSVYVTLYNKITKNTRLILKMVTSVLFLSVGFCAAIINKSGNSSIIFMLLGLHLGLFGDLFLGIRKFKEQENFQTKYFTLGILMFFLGHVSYIIAFNYNFLVGVKIVTIIIATAAIAIAIAIVIVVDIVIAFKLKVIMKILTYSYIFILVVALVSVLFNAIYYKNILWIILSIGILFFIVSDCILSYLYKTQREDKFGHILKIINIIHITLLKVF